MKKFIMLASFSVAAAIAEEKEHKHEDVDKTTVQSASQEEGTEVTKDAELHVLTSEVPQGAILREKEREPY